MNFNFVSEALVQKIKHLLIVNFLRLSTFKNIIQVPPHLHP